MYFRESKTVFSELIRKIDASSGENLVINQKIAYINIIVVWCTTFIPKFMSEISSRFEQHIIDSGIPAYRFLNILRSEGPTIRTVNRKYLSHISRA